MILKLVLSLTILIFLNSTNIVAAEENTVCVRERANTASECLTEEELTELRERIILLFRDRQFGKVHNALKDLYLDDDESLLSSRAAVYFFQTEKHAKLCEAVRDLENAIGEDKGRAVVTIGYLNALYYGDWRNVAALEGNLYARLELVAERLHLSENDYDTMRKLNPKLFFERLLSLLVLKDSQKVGIKLNQRLQDVRSEALKLAKADGLKPGDLDVQYVEPREVICKPR